MLRPVAIFDGFIMNKTFFRNFAVGFVLTSALMASSGKALAAGDANRGQALYEGRCTACHSLDANRVGPAHRGVYGRKAGSAPGYAYSPGVKASRIIWNEVSLDKWLTNPQALIPGARMGFRVGVPQERADLIAFLKRESAKKK
jgi:cytochrome c